MKKIVFVVIFFLSLFLLALKVEKVNSESYFVRFEYKVINQLNEPQDIVLALSLPQTNERQTINYVYHQKPDSEIIDQYGNKVLLYEFKNVAKNEICQAGWIVDCTIHGAIYHPEKSAKVLTAKEKIDYLKDSPNYLITSPLIQSTLKQILTKNAGTYEKAFQIFSYLIKNITYYRDDRWDTAVDVLEKKQGSCSEYNFAFISLLRAAGIPSRYTGATVLHPDYLTKYDSRIYEDAVFHRWTEFFVENDGWFPADASRGSTALKKFDNIKNLWGRLPLGLLQTFRGDGGDNTPLGWDYIAANKVSSRNPDSKKDIPVAYWIKKESRQNIKKIIEDLQKKINNLTYQEINDYCSDYLSREVLLFFSHQLKQELYPSLIKALLDQKHPQAIYFSLLARQKQLLLPKELGFEMFSDGELINEIKKYLKDNWDWSFFEYWWRKARSLIFYDQKNKEFKLSATDIDIY